MLVLTPDALHYEPAMACAELRKHLLCEKPVGTTVEQAADIWHAYRDSGLAHFVPYWTRYVPVILRAKQLVDAGRLGEIRVIIYRWHNPRPMAMPFTWRDDAELSSAGSIADVGSHAYDTMRWILDQEAERVLVHAGVIAPAKPDLGAINLGEALEWGQSHTSDDSSQSRTGTAFDYADIAFQLESGAVGSLVLSHAPYLRTGLAPELELHGTEASLGVDRVTGRLTLRRPGGDLELLETLEDPGFGNRFTKHVFPAVRARAASEVTDHPGLYDGWRVQLFTDAAALSAIRGGWVELAELDAEA